MGLEKVLTMPGWTSELYSKRRENLLVAQNIRNAFRGFFGANNFVEVDLPILQVSPGNEQHIHAFKTRFFSTDGSAHRELYLRSSPEFACKKLLAAGEAQFFTFAPSFRNKEYSPLHHPEFTMLEWYRANEEYLCLIKDCMNLLMISAEAAQTIRFHYNELYCNPFCDPVILSVSDAFKAFAGVDFLSTIDEDGFVDRARFAVLAERSGVRISVDDGWSDIFSKILTERVEPNIGIGTATILLDYPITEAALARTQSADPRLVERFELYVCGVELANAFGELTNPNEQRRRFEVDMATQHTLYGQSYPIDEDFLDALSSMPNASGIALGFDRLVMLATGADHITEVLWLPLDYS